MRPFFLALSELGSWAGGMLGRWACLLSCPAVLSGACLSRSKGLAGNSEGRMRGAGAGALKRLGNISGFYSPRFTLILLIPYTRVHAHPRTPARACRHDEQLRGQQRAMRCQQRADEILWYHGYAPTCVRMCVRTCVGACARMCVCVRGGAVSRKPSRRL